MIDLVDISQDAGAYTTSAPVCLVSLLCWTDNWLQLESIDTDRAYNLRWKLRELKYADNNYLSPKVSEQGSHGIVIFFFLELDLNKMIA